MSKEENILEENILVTGGTGFIGSHFVKLIMSYGYHPIIIDKFTYASDINRLKGIENDIYIGNRLYVGDICDYKLVSKIIKDHNIDTIVNFAAETHVDNSIKNSDDFIHSNIEGVYSLLEISRKFGLKLVQISTDEIYGSIENGSFRETDRLNPSNPYSASKASADLLVLSYYKTYGLPIIITRSSNNYGPFQNPEKFVPKMITDAINKKPLSVYGNGENIRDWLYVEDNCIAIKLVMERGNIGEIYNIGGGNELTNNQVAKIISDKFNIPIKYVADRPGHDLRYSIDCSKIKKELCWCPIKSFDIGIKETINHYRLNHL